MNYNKLHLYKEIVGDEVHHQSLKLLLLVHSLFNWKSLSVFVEFHLKLFPSLFMAETFRFSLSSSDYVSADLTFSANRISRKWRWLLRNGTSLPNCESARQSWDCRSTSIRFARHEKYRCKRECIKFLSKRFCQLAPAI